MPLRSYALQRAFISIGLLLMLITVNLCQARVADQPDGNENQSPHADAHTRPSPEETPPLTHQAVITVEDTALCDDADVSKDTLHRIRQKARTPLARR